MNNIIAAMKSLSENELHDAAALLRWLNAAPDRIGLSAHQVLSLVPERPKRPQLAEDSNEQ